LSLEKPPFPQILYYYKYTICVVFLNRVGFYGRGLAITAIGGLIGIVDKEVQEYLL